MFDVFVMIMGGPVSANAQAAITLNQLAGISDGQTR